MRQARTSNFLVVLVLILSTIFTMASAAPVNKDPTGAVCPSGNVKWETDGGYEYTDGSATVTGNANSVTVTAAPGFTITGVCIKIGGPGGGETLTFNSGGDFGPFEYGISHVVVTTEPDETDVCSETFVVYGEWSEWQVDPQDSTREFRTRTVTYVSAIDEETVCSEEVQTQYRNIPDEFSISTELVCGDEPDTMVSRTTILAPEGASGTLATLWYYPNGDPFITGESSLGPVGLDPGTNVFEMEFTLEELNESIGENNLTGGNPANDVDYDKLELYSYDVRLYLDSEPLVSNMAPLWRTDCGDGDGEEKLTCPTCGPPIKETMGDSMGIAWFSDLPCTSDNVCFWYENNNPWTKLWTRVRSHFTHEGETTALSEVTDANGDTCYVSFFRDGQARDAGDFILWGPEGEGDRYREHVPDSERALHKYSSCSIYPSWCDTRLVDGVEYAVWMPGHNESDWAAFLLENDFFPNEEYRGDAALEWARKLRKNGNEALMTWDGNLDSLPLFELPPR